MFGIVHLATVATSPFVGKLVTKFGLRSIFILGVVFLSIASIGFGFLVFLNQTVLFLVVAYILRLINDMSFFIFF